MDRVAARCNIRFNILGTEPGGAALLAYRDEDRSIGQASRTKFDSNAEVQYICRQDHPKACSIFEC